MDIRINLSSMFSVHWASSVPYLKWMVKICVFHARETFSFYRNGLNVESVIGDKMSSDTAKGPF